MMRAQKKRPVPLLLLALATTISSSGCVIPTSTHPSLWTSLGIPQVWNAAGSHSINRLGANPNRELKPPLKRLADPANLESETPAIKKAAEIKQAEDAKKQKIKAVRYLAESVGCGCYDEDGGVTEALVAALDDCTEEVRYATVKSLLARAEMYKQEGACSRCNGNCCNQKLTDKLSSLVYDMDDKGCRVEPSERVRITAKAVLQICCPTQCQNYYQNMQPQIIPNQEGPPAEEEKNLEGVPDRLPAIEGDPSDPAMEEGAKDLSVDADSGIPTISMDREAGFSNVSYSAPGRSQLNAGEIPEGPKKELLLGGAVREVARKENCLFVEFNESVQLPVGTRLQLKRRQKLGRIDYLGEVEVLKSDEGNSVVQPVPPLSIQRIDVGDSIMLTR